LWSRPRAARTVALLAGIALLVLALPATAMALIASLERDLPLSPSAGEPPGAIVVLGGDETRISGSGTPMAIGPISLLRARAAAERARTLGLPILVTGGDAWRRGVPVATLMARALADDFGTPAHWVETTSLDTWQNARESAALLRAAGIRSAYIVTDAWHMRRALLAFYHFGIVATAAPTLLDPWPSGQASEFVPQAHAWVVSYYALHEWVGYLYYLARS
jgi:uncharacterized SAM-binding protein YcdF (DUF218 family)